MIPTAVAAWAWPRADAPIRPAEAVERAIQSAIDAGDYETLGSEDGPNGRVSLVKVEPSYFVLILGRKIEDVFGDEKAAMGAFGTYKKYEVGSEA
jgi:hypothetical protein